MADGNDSEDTAELIEAQLREQQEALEGILELEALDESDLSQTRRELQESIAELEDLLRQQQGEVPLSSKQDGVMPRQHYRFRHTDGRWYHGVAEEVQPQAVKMSFLRPTKLYMLAGVRVVPSLLKDLRPATDSEPGFQIGSRVYASQRDGGLWEAAEVASSSNNMATLVFERNGMAVSIPHSRIAHSAYASDSDSAEEGPEEGSLPVNRLETESSSDDESGREALEERRASHLATSPLSQAPEPGQVQLFRPQAGLGSEGAFLGNAEHSSQRKKKRGGVKARRRKQAEAAFSEREAKRAAQKDVERETGTEGVFALVNQRLGDQSAAARILKKAQQQTLKDSEEQSKFTGHQAEETRPQAQNRRSLVVGQEDIAVARAKVARLQDMGQRNKRDLVIAKQVAAKLAEAQAELSALEKGQRSSLHALQSKEKHKQWLKF